MELLGHSRKSSYEVTEMPLAASGLGASSTSYLQLHISNIRSRYQCKTFLRPDVSRERPQLSVSCASRSGTFGETTNLCILRNGGQKLKTEPRLLNTLSKDASLCVRGQVVWTLDICNACCQLEPMTQSGPSANRWKVNDYR